jgi:hypothetical protein
VAGFGISGVERLLFCYRSVGRYLPKFWLVFLIQLSHLKISISFVAEKCSHYFTVEYILPSHRAPLCTELRGMNHMLGYKEIRTCSFKEELLHSGGELALHNILNNKEQRIE